MYPANRSGWDERAAPERLWGAFSVGVRIPHQERRLSVCSGIQFGTRERDRERETRRLVAKRRVILLFADGRDKW